MQTDFRWFNPTLAACATLLVAGLPQPASAAPAMSATKSDGVPAATKVLPGSTITYTHSVANGTGAGITTATGVEFRDPNVAGEVPGTTYVPATLAATPVAIDDVYPSAVVPNTGINTILTGGFSVVSNDFPGLTGGAVVANTALTITAFDATSVGGGAVNVILSGADVGRFSYTPARGFTGTDTFTYTVSNGVPGATSNSIRGTVSITVSGPAIWFVDANASSNGTGTLASPYNTLSAFQAVNNGAAGNPKAGDSIFLYESASGTYSGGVTLLASQRLIGQDASGSLDTLAGVTLPADTVALPSTNSGNGTTVRLLNAAGNGVTMGATSRLHGFTIGNCSGFAISGGNVGSVQISNLIVNTDGAGISLGPVDFGASSSFLSFTSTGGTAGVALTNASGTLPFGSGVLSGHSGTTFSCNQGTANLSYSGTITKTTAGVSVSITNKTAGTVALSGAITATNCAGVNLAANTGATIAFTGGMAISSAGNAGFTATGGGTVTASQNNGSIVNTITTTSGPGLEVRNTTIGAAGLTFRSITSGAGANNGITLDTTGLTAGLTVTGLDGADGDTNPDAASGGTISGKTGSDGTATGHGIYLNNTFNVSLSGMQLNDFQNSAIRGFSVTRFRLSYSVISGFSGDNSAATEGAITFGTSNPSGANGLVGTAANASVIDNVNIRGGIEHSLEFYNQTGAFGLTISNCNIHDNSTVSGSDGIQIELQGTSSGTVNIANSIFSNNRSQAIQVSATDSAVVDLTVANNTITRGTQGNEGIIVQNAGNADLRTTIINNNISGFGGTSIFAGQVAGNATASSFLEATIIANTVTSPTTATNHSVIVFLTSTVGQVSQARILVEQNAITQNSTSGVARGILIDTPDTGTTPAFDATVVNNLVNIGDNVTGVVGLVAQARNGAGRFDVRLNRVNFPNGVPAGVAGLRVRQNTAAGTASLARGVSASGSPAATVIAANNTLSTTEILGTVTVIENGVVLAPGTPALPLMFTPLPEETSLAPSNPGMDFPAAAEGIASAPFPAPAVQADLSEKDLRSLVAAARQRWEDSGLTDTQRELLAGVRFELGELSDGRLGEAAGETIRIDRNAGGNGWFIDPTPLDDAEFASGGAAILPDATGRVDLLTTLLHEMGHRLGLCDSYVQEDDEGLMYGFLSKSQRRLPRQGEAAAAVPHGHEEPHYLTAPVTIGTLPPGKSVVITYQVKVNDPPTVVPITSQATVLSTTASFSTFLTDDLPSGGDPALPGAADPTVTLVDLPDVSVAVSPSSVTEDGADNLVYTFTRVGSTAAALTANFNVTGTASFTTDYTVSGAATFSATAGSVTFPAGSSTAAVTISPTDDTAVEPDETVVLTLAASAAYDVVAPSGASGTITNDDTSIAVAVSPASVTEDGTGNITYTFTRAGVTTGALTANFSVGGTAAFTTDYTQTGAATFTGSSGTVAFAAGALTASVVIDPVADNAVETDETVVLTPTTGTGYNPVTTPASSTISNDDSTVKVEMLAATSVTEDGGTNLVYTFTRTGPAANSLNVLVEVGGTAARTGDYTHNIGSFNPTFNPSYGIGTVAFAAGASVATVTIDPTTDSTQEPDETVIITLATPAAPASTGGYEVGTPASATGTILDDDLPVVSIAATTATATEGGSAGLYTFTRNSTTGSLTANFELDASSLADPETDFILSGTGVTFNAAAGTGTIEFPDTVATVGVTLTATTEPAIAGGQIAEADETARLNIVPQANVYNGTSNATVTIAANGFIVANTSDAGEGSLRQAVLNANAIAGTDTVRFSDGTAGTVNFTDTTPETITVLSEIAIGTPLTIQGTGAGLLSISGGDATRVVAIDTTGAVSLADLTVRNGRSSSGGGIGAQGGVQLLLTRCVVSNNQIVPVNGAGILHRGGPGSSLSLNQCSIASNSTTGGVGGAGIHNEALVATISNTTFSGNVSDSSGGAYRQQTLGASSAFTNCTFSGNTASSTGGGAIRLVSQGSLALTNCTVTDNRLISGTGGGINAAALSTVTLHNTVVADNYLGNSPGTTRSDISSVLVGASSNNLIGVDTNLTGITNGTNGNQIGTAAVPLNPVIGPLANNGGPTLTHALLAGSPGLNAGNNAVVAADTFDLDGDSDTTEPVPFDQRGTGFFRTIGTVDIGAIELQKAFSIAAGAATIGEAAGPATFTVSRVGGTVGDAAVTYTVSGITGDPAVAADFGATLPTGTVTILDGQSSATLSIPIVNDTIVEADESFRVTLSDPAAGYAIQTATADTQIIDNDSATLSIAKVSDGAETNPTATSGVFRVTQSSVSSSDTTVSYTLGGTATPGTDFTAPSGTVTITAGSTSADITIPVIRDFTVEPVETIIATLTTITASDAQITVGTPASASVDIIDSAPASIAVSSGSPQSATVNTTFGSLVAVVRDAAGNNLQGASVTFTAPGSGASGSFASSATVLTNASGLATAPAFTANTIAGSYTVTASSVGTPASFSLVNTPGAAASLAVSAPPSATAGTSFNVTVTARDSFGNTATGYSGTVHFTSTDPGATLPADGTLTNGVRTLSATLVTGGSRTITATDTVTSGINGVSGAVNVSALADLSITKTDGVTTATPGGSVTYTITASNAGPSPVVGATVTDTFPASFTGTWTAVGAGGGTVTAAGSGNINDTVNLPVGGSVTYTVSGTISASATGTLSNTATVGSTTTDPVPGNNSASDTDTLVPSADLAITVTDGVASAVPGQSVTYTIIASNAGPSNVSGATVADAFPASLTNITWTGLGAGGGTATASGAGNINDTVNLPAGGSVTYTVSATIAPGATGSLSNTATVSSSVTDSNPGNNSATDTDTLTPQADLSITKTDGVTTAVPGGSVTYTITASNSGPSTATGATVADTLPASLTGTWTASVAGGATAGTLSGSGNINQNVTLPPGGSVTYTVSATISAAATGTLSNTATVTAPGGTTDGNPGNNNATDTDTLTPRADLAITVTDGTATAIPGGTVTYTITASNAGPSNVTGATVTDAFPPELSSITWTGAGAGGGTVTASGSGNINDTVNLPAGGSVTYTVSATVSPAATGTLVNTANVTSSVTDPTPGNNSATDTDTLTPQADVSVAVVDSPDPVNAGSNVTYTITVTNSGLSTAGEVTFNNAIPAGTTFVSLSAPGGWSATTPPAGATGNISASVPGMSVGNAIFTLVVKVDYVANGTILTNTSTVATATDPATANNTGTATTTVVAIPEIALFNGASDLAPPITDGQPGVIDYGNTTVGNTVTRTFTVKNVGTGTLSLSAITVPAGFSLPVPFTSQNVAPTASFSFAVRYDAAAIGTASGSVIIASNDADEASFDFPVSATRTNVAPTANARILSTDEDVPLPITLTASDPDVGQTLTYAVQAGPTNGSLSGSGANLTYTPNANYFGPDSFTFRVNDGTADSPVVSVDLTINAVNDAPVAVAQNVSTNEDTALLVTLAGTDIENSPLTYTVSTPPAQGTLSGTAPNLTYTPNENYFGPDSFAFTVNDGTVDSVPSVISITVNAVNDVPVALAQNVSTNEDTALPITLAGTDIENSPLAYTVSTPPAHGVLSGTAPNLTYTPNANYFGPDSFTFTVNDGTVDSAPSVVSITVDSVNDVPVVVAAIPDEVLVTPGNSRTVTLPPYFSDVETASSDLVYTVSPASSTFYSTSITAGVLTITSTAPGIVDLTVTATDADNASVSDTFRVTVKNLPEIAGSGVPDTVLSPAAPDQTIDLAGYFLDRDNDALTYAVVTNSDPSKVSYVLVGSMLTLHPLDPGDTTFTVSATDIDGNSVQDSFVVTVEDPIPALTPTVGFTPKVNNQTGYFEVSVTAVNNNVFDIPGFRLRVTSALPAGITLRNSSGPAGAFEPYLDILTRLSPGQSITVILEFHSATRNFDGFNPTIIAEPLPGGIIDTGTGLGVDITLIKVLPGSAGVLLEFTSQPGAFYQVEYSSNLTTWKKCLVPIQAGANRVQWIDRGPPYTDTHPGTAGSRYYRVSRID